MKALGWQLYTNRIALSVELRFETESVTMTWNSKVPVETLLLTTPLAELPVYYKVRKLGALISANDIVGTASDGVQLIVGRSKMAY